MSFAALGLLGVVTLTALGAATLTALTATLRVRLLRGAVGLVAVATVIKWNSFELFHFNNKKAPFRVLRNKLKQNRTSL